MDADRQCDTEKGAKLTEKRGGSDGNLSKSPVLLRALAHCALSGNDTVVRVTARREVSERSQQREMEVIRPTLKTSGSASENGGRACENGIRGE